MNGSWILPFLWTISGIGQVQTPFSRYVGSVATHRPEQRFMRAALACGLDPNRGRAVYGAAVGDALLRTPDFPKAVYNLESDFFWTAALWSKNGRPLLLDFWSVDDSVIVETNAVVCLDKDGRPSGMQVTTWSLPVEPGSSGWSYVQSRSLNVGGKTIQRKGSFMDVGLNKAIPKPHLDSDEEKSYDWIPEQSTLREVIRKLKEPGKK